MSKLAAYMQLLTDDRPEHDRYWENRTRAMTQFGLSDVEQRAVLSGNPASIRTEIARAQQPKADPPRPVPITTKPTPPPPPKP
jgi:hypothetical protein